MNKIRHQSRRIIILKLLIVIAFGIGCGASSSRTQTVVVSAVSGETRFEAELADTQVLRERGLMNRTDLTDESAMLFVWPNDVDGGFWMKDTPTSLDIIFIDSSMRVNFIAANTTPLSTDIISPLNSYRYVLEVKAGFVERSGLVVGDRVDVGL